MTIMLTMTMTVLMMWFHYMHAVKSLIFSFRKRPNSVLLQIVASNSKKDLTASLTIKICMPKVQSFAQFVKNRFVLIDHSIFELIMNEYIQINRFRTILKQTEWLQTDK